jgi:hypothetical protein
MSPIVERYVISKVVLALKELSMTPWRHVGKWRYSSTIPDLGTRWKWVVSFTSFPLYPRIKSPWCPLDRSGRRRLKGTQCLGHPVSGGYNTGTWPSRLVESRVWDSKMWSWVPRDSDLGMTAMAKASSNCKRQTHPLVRRMLHKDYDRKCSVEKKTLQVVSLKGIVAKTNLLAVNLHS